MEKLTVIREARASDHAFILQMSPYLAEVAQLAWHSDEDIEKMQYQYIAQMLAKTTLPNRTLIAEVDHTPAGFIHVRTHKDSITSETCATIPLLAVSPKSQDMGLGKTLIEHAQHWAKSLGCRLLHLEVFANNTKATGFYQNLGFKAETIHMVKPI